MTSSPSPLFPLSLSPMFLERLDEVIWNTELGVGFASTRVDGINVAFIAHADMGIIWSDGGKPRWHRPSIASIIAEMLRLTAKRFYGQRLNGCGYDALYRELMEVIAVS